MLWKDNGSQTVFVCLILSLTAFYDFEVVAFFLPLTGISYVN